MEKKIIDVTCAFAAVLEEKTGNCGEGEDLCALTIPVEDAKMIIEYILATEKAKAPCTATEEAKNTAFDHTIEMMRSSDYKERFRAEYEQTKIRYEKLKKFNTKIEASEIAASYKAGVVAPEHDCPVYLLREHQRKMGEYLHLLEVRAEIEHIEL